MSEVIIALSACRTTITAMYQTGGSPPGANNWQCESGVLSSYVAGVTTDADGKASATIQGISSDVNSKVVTLVPLASAGTPASASTDMGGNLFGWRCGAAADGTDLLRDTCRAPAAGTDRAGQAGSSLPFATRTLSPLFHAAAACRRATSRGR